MWFSSTSGILLQLHPLLFIQSGEFDRNRVGHLSTKKRKQDTVIYEIYIDSIPIEHQLESHKLFVSTSH